MFDASLYDLMMETSGALSGAIIAQLRENDDFVAPPLLLQLRAGFAESPGWFLVQATEFDPQPLTVANLRVRDVYGSERLVQAFLELMASEGWFDRDGERYCLTEAGRAIIERSRERRRRIAARLSSLADPDLAHLVELFARLVTASLNSATPPGTWCLAHSRHRAPEEAAPALVKLMQYFDDFNAFRDDAHMAAWQLYHVSGFAWEAFSLVWSEAAHSPEEVVAQLSHRGYTKSDYAAALQELVQRGWLQATTEAVAFSLTEQGRAVREQVERLTDQYFYAPWSCLTEEEIAQIPTSLTHLRDQFQELETSPR